MNRLGPTDRLCETLVSWRLLVGGLSPAASHHSFTTSSEEPPLLNFQQLLGHPPLVLRCCQAPDQVQQFLLPHGLNNLVEEVPVVEFLVSFPRLERAAALVPANKKKDPRYAGIYRDMPGYSGMGPRRLRPMIVGVPLEPGVGGMGGEYDIDAEGVDGGGPDPDRRRCRR